MRVPGSRALSINKVGDRQHDLPPQFPLDAAPAVPRIEAACEHVIDHVIMDVDQQVLLDDTLALEDTLEIEVGDAGGLLARERMEQDDVLEAIDELGPKLRFDRAKGLVGVVAPALDRRNRSPGVKPSNAPAFDVAMMMVLRKLTVSPCGVVRCSLVEKLQEEVEDIAVRLFQFVEQQNLERLQADRIDETGRLRR